ncbi:putative membrane-bound lytic murein transglycosylase [Marinomonas sp. MED121]|uniref:lytic transglycosylase n=1 Tax=Marinomonas sp. MED121 TaxID=314277 RepID=UPI00006911BD|nr:LysM peptidoglycan-binding domain-containing protein [Marinomonas sp. MED121]EAQ67066.1 putative membrane-bound lytic murein transglycosylase [Marinomonas sp. MED121]
MTKQTLIAATFCFVLTGCQSLTSEQDQAATQATNEQNSATSNLDADMIDANLTNEAEDSLVYPLDTRDVALSPAVIDDIPLPEEVAEIDTNKAEAPIKPVVEDVAPEPLPPIDLWQRMQAGFALDLELNKPRISSQLKWFVSHPSYLDRVSRRGSRYLHYIVEELEKANLPLEIALLPIVESGFDPFGYSHGRASGPWQFIPSTGRMYGLDQDWWYDGRRDIVGSTRAAIAYLTRLNKMFDGDWLHALAAYNSGEGRVARAIKRNKNAGKPTDFWSLKLPKETRAYVPKLLALGKLFKNPEKYNYTLREMPNEPYFEIVNIGGQIDLAQAAEMAGISIDEVYLLNPGFNQWATSPTGPHRLLIPVDKAKTFRSRLVSIPADERVTWVRYTVDSGDNLALIAKQHNTTVNVLQDVNKMSSTLIRVGQQLMIPVAGSKIESYTLSSHQRLLAKQNRSPSQNRVKINYTVKSGDSFWKISQKYKTTSKQLARWNNMGIKDPLFAGQKLVVWLKSEKRINNTSRSVTKKIIYTIRSGDSLAKVAGKFRVKLADIKKWNPKVTSQKYVQPGDRLTLLINVVAG